MLLGNLREETWRQRLAPCPGLLCPPGGRSTLWSRVLTVLTLTPLSYPQDARFPALSLHPLASLAQNGARPGAPALPPVGWARPPGCPTRTASANWRLSVACACPGPARQSGATAHWTEPSRAGWEWRCTVLWPLHAALAAGGSPAWVHHLRPTDRSPDCVTRSVCGTVGCGEHTSPLLPLVSSSLV